jgi:hypothetical protein
MSRHHRRVRSCSVDGEPGHFRLEGTALLSRQPVTREGRNLPMRAYAIHDRP